MNYKYINNEAKRDIVNNTISNLKIRLIKNHIIMDNLDITKLDNLEVNKSLDSEISNFISNDADCKLYFEDLQTDTNEVEIFTDCQKDYIVKKLKKLSVKIMKQCFKDIDLEKMSEEDVEAHLSYLNINLADLISELAYDFDVELKDLINAK